MGQNTKSIPLMFYSSYREYFCANFRIFHANLPSLLVFSCFFSNIRAYSCYAFAGNHFFPFSFKKILKKVLTPPLRSAKVPLHTATHKHKNMRTKALLCAAGLLAAGVATSMAQSNVYSLNIVGYANVKIISGPGLYNNPFDLDG